MQGMQFSEYMTNDDVLQIAVQSGILNMKEIAADVDEMKRKELLSLHTHEIWQNSKGMYLTYVYDENGNRKIRRRKTKEEIEGRIKFAMQDAETLCLPGTLESNPKAVATWKSAKDSTKFDQDAFKADHPGLYDQYCKTVPGTRRFLIK